MHIAGAPRYFKNNRQLSVTSAGLTEILYVRAEQSNQVYAHPLP